MPMPKSVLIRADGNSDIATGHLMRTLSIASALARTGGQVSYAVADEVSRELLRSFMNADPASSDSEFPVFVLDSDYRNPDSELDALKILLQNRQFDLLLVDSYFVTESYFESISENIPWPGLQIAYIDDLYAFDPPVDVLINYDIAPPADFYTKAKRKLLGGKYTPLREQFAKEHFLPGQCTQTAGDSFRESVRDSLHVLISTGGTDPFRVAGDLVSILNDPASRAYDNDPALCRFGGNGCPDPSAWHYHVLAGSMHACREHLEQQAAQNPRIHLYEKVTDMAALMQQCDLAVSAAGTTLYELCAMGLPAVSFTFADNQLITARDMAEYAGIPYAGDMRTDFTPICGYAADDPSGSTTEHDGITEHGYAGENLCLRRIIRHLLTLASDASVRRSLSVRMRSLIDGHGAEYIAEALLDTPCCPTILPADAGEPQKEAP